MDLFEDPITFAVMQNAVISKTCGHSFDEKSILDWISRNPSCPICNSELNASDLTPNWALRQAIETFQNSQQTQPTSTDTTTTTTASTEGAKNMDPSLLQSLQVQGTLQPQKPSEREIKVVRLSEDDAKAAGEKLARIFFSSHDPWFQYIFNDDSNFEAASWFMQLVVYYGCQQGYVYGVEIDSNLVGISVWQAPVQGMGVSYWKLLQSGLASGPWKLGFFVMTRLMSIMMLSESWHLSLTNNSRHWSLYTIGLSTSFQDQGIGTELMRRILRRVDEDGCLVYTDTSNPRNLSFFQRLGFEVQEVTKPTVGPTFWICIRPARSSSSDQTTATKSSPPTSTSSTTETQ